MADANPTISMTLNLNELNNLVKGRDYHIRKKEKDPTYHMLSTNINFRFRDANRLNVK